MPDETPSEQETNDIYEEPEVMPIRVAITNTYSPKKPIRQLRESE
jgi:hypothetical protein